MTSREIKFRAWDGEKMIFMDMSKDGIYPCGSHKALMQYTGLKDKNGTEIYESDIVKTFAFDKNHIGEVYFQPTRLNWSVKHSPYTNQDMFVYSRPDFSIEVIGNIYENPSLLENSEVLNG